MPPYRYALLRKIELAKQLLSETAMSVKEIASYLSFEDEFYFSGLFRQKTGHSPTGYRKAMTEGSALSKDEA
jgi:AraC-like DNA-binding protein